MYCNPFKFLCYGPGNQDLSPNRNTSKALKQIRKSSCMTNNTVACNRFCQDGPLKKLCLIKKKLLHSPVLVSKLYFEVQDLLTVTNESEMAGFNNTGMNGSYPYFMKLFSFNVKERIFRHLS